MIEAVGRAGDRAIDLLAGGLLLVIVVLAIIQVMVRYLLGGMIFGGSLSWIDEISTLFWVWMVQIASVKVAHMAIESIVARLPRSPRLLIATTMAGLSTGLLALLAWGSWQMAELTKRDYHTTLDWLSVKYTFLALVILAPLWALVVLARCVREWQHPD